MNIPLDRVPSELMLDSEPIHVSNFRGNSWPSRGSDTRSRVVNNTTMVDRTRNVATDALGQITSLRRLRTAILLLTMVLLSIVVVLCATNVRLLRGTRRFYTANFVSCSVVACCAAKIAVIWSRPLAVT